MPANKLKEFLDDNRVKYISIRHSPAYTAQEVAASAHVKGKEMAKIVIIKLDGKMAMAVLPASYKVDLKALKVFSKAKKAEFATEKEFRDKFPECETGAMPPFGNLYGMKVYVARSLAEDKHICFNACSHIELIQMTYSDFSKIVKPEVVEFSIKSS